jgi:hypothetical protein
MFAVSVGVADAKRACGFYQANELCAQCEGRREHEWDHHVCQRHKITG